MYSITDEQKKITFYNIEIKKCKLHYPKYPIDINKIHIDKIIKFIKVFLVVKRF